jgi:thymidine phosphorylase
MKFFTELSSLGKIAPADKIMYACRDKTSTVGNLSLQTSSIVSKKAAESISALVLDVKFGKGCYQPTLEYAETVAMSLVTVAKSMGIKTTAVISAMDDPLGRCIGNSLEVAEAILCLKGQGPHDLEELVVKQGGLLLSSSGSEGMSVMEGELKIKKSLQSGSALRKVIFRLQLAYKRLRDCCVARLRDCYIARLRDCCVARLRDYSVACKVKFRLQLK